MDRACLWTCLCYTSPGTPLRSVLLRGPTASPFLPAPKANGASHSNAKPSLRQGVWDQAENLRQSVAHSAPVSALVLSWSTGLLPRTLQGALSPQTIGLVLLGKSTARHSSLRIRNSNSTQGCKSNHQATSAFCQLFLLRTTDLDLTYAVTCLT